MKPIEYVLIPAIILAIGASVAFGIMRAEQTRREQRREQWKAECAQLKTEGIEHDTRWSETFGCLVRRGDLWRRL